MSGVQFKAGDLVVYKFDSHRSVRVVLKVSEGRLGDGGVRRFLHTDNGRATAVSFQRPTPVQIAKYRCENE